MTASRSSRRARLIATLGAGAVALVAGPALASCSAGKITQTGAQVPAVPGANANVGHLALRDLLIAYNDPNGYPRGGSAPLIVRIFNNGPKTVKLVKVTAEGTAERVVLVGAGVATQAPVPSPTAASPTVAPASPATPSPAATVTPRTAATPAPPGGQAETFSVEIPPGGFALLVPGNGAHLQLTRLTTPVRPGDLVPVTFTFDDGSSVTVEIPFGPPQSPPPRESPVVPGSEEHAAE